jgi:hypothetical protein
MGVTVIDDIEFILTELVKGAAPESMLWDAMYQAILILKMR